MAFQRNVYLNMQTLAEARALLFAHFGDCLIRDSETVAVPEAVGRVLAGAVSARISSPHFHAAAMDGIAVRAEETFGASETRPVTLEIGADAFFVNTGHVLPPETNAVIMIEHVVMAAEDRAVIEKPAFPWQNVRKMGEDIVATELLFPRNHVVTPYCVGALLSGGVTAVAVRRRPRALIIPTGSELVDCLETPPEALLPGQVLETNSFVLGKLIEACGGVYTRHARMPDDPESIRAVVREAAAAADCDLILTVGGSSAGTKDYAREVVAGLGTVLVHGVTIMPGKPVLLGAVNAKPVFGMPGYQVSAIVAFEQFVQPLLRRMLGAPDDERPQVAVQPTRKIASKLGVEEFLRVKLGMVGERIVATPLPRGAGNITSLTEADGILRIPVAVEGVSENEPVTVELLRPLASIRNTIVIVGSHDNTLDVLADQIKAVHSNVTISSSHVGSMGGLMALRKGVCHLAGAHLLDTASGEYNLPYIRRLLTDTPVRLVNLVIREQGLIVRPGNPKDIRGIADMARADVRFINRQGGSGTRILLDYKLQQVGLSPEGITGYRSEEFTHMAVAVAVLSGAANAGLGIYAAARALNLDFIPVVTEQYDLVIPEAYLDSEKIRILLETINTAEFKAAVGRLGGYSTEKTGTYVL
jgi:putative molybdopterin biosynthesis protein